MNLGIMSFVAASIITVPLGASANTESEETSLLLGVLGGSCYSGPSTAEEIEPLIRMSLIEADPAFFGRQDSGTKLFVTPQNDGRAPVFMLVTDDPKLDAMCGMISANVGVAASRIACELLETNFEEVLNGYQGKKKFSFKNKGNGYLFSVNLEDEDRSIYLECEVFEDLNEKDWQKNGYFKAQVTHFGRRNTSTP